MSSHHIVREKQEPALLVLHLGDFSFEHLGQLLEWSPTVIATKETADQLVDNHIKVDWIITDQSKNETQSDVRIIPLTNQTYLSAAFSYLITAQYPAVNVITDNDDVDRYFEYIKYIDLVIYTPTEKVYPISSGFNKWKPAGEQITLKNTPIDFSYKGLEQLSADKYQTISDGFITLSFSNPAIFIAEEI